MKTKHYLIIALIALVALSAYYYAAVYLPALAQAAQLNIRN